MTADQMDQIRRLYQPSIESLASHLPDLGKSLYFAADELAGNCTVERVDSFLDLLQAATNTVVHIRKALAGPRESNVQSSGTG